MPQQTQDNAFAKAITPPILYDIYVEGRGYQHKINWGNSPGWATEFRDDLNNAHRISMVPKDTPYSRLPIVTVALGGQKRWIAFSRCFGRTSQVERIRLYGIGWQATVKGKNIKSLCWIYPNGTLEIADDPTMWSQFLDMIAGTAQAKV